MRTFKGCEAIDDDRDGNDNDDNKGGGGGGGGEVGEDNEPLFFCFRWKKKKKRINKQICNKQIKFQH